MLTVSPKCRRDQAPLVWEGVAETRRLCVPQVLRNAINRVALYSLRLAASHVHCARPGSGSGALDRAGARASLAVPRRWRDSRRSCYSLPRCRLRRIVSTETRNDSQGFVTGVSWMDGELGRRRAGSNMTGRTLFIAAAEQAEVRAVRRSKYPRSTS